MRRLRDAMPIEERAKKSARIFELLKNERFYKEAQVVMLYLSFGSEVDTFKILDDILETGKTAVVPVSDTASCEIIPSVLCGRDELKKGAYGIYEPCGINIVDKEKIDLVIVPGMVFDRKGGRIGYGKGYYDRFLENTNAVKAALCYEIQLVEKAAASEWDVPMDVILTERSVIRCGETV